MAWIFYALNFIPIPAVQREIDLIANVQDLMIKIAEIIGDGESATPHKNILIKI